MADGGRRHHDWRARQAYDPWAKCEPKGKRKFGRGSRCEAAEPARIGSKGGGISTAEKTIREAIRQQEELQHNSRLLSKTRRCRGWLRYDSVSACAPEDTAVCVAGLRGLASGGAAGVVAAHTARSLAAQYPPQATAPSGCDAPVASPQLLSRVGLAVGNVAVSFLGSAK